MFPSRRRAQQLHTTYTFVRATAANRGDSLHGPGGPPSADGIASSIKVRDPTLALRRSASGSRTRAKSHAACGIRATQERRAEL